MKIFKARKALGLLSCATFLILGGLVLLCIGYHRDYRGIPRETAIGNTPSSLKVLKEKGLPFSFLVIGDSQTSKRARTLIERASKQGEPSFMVILGDFVKEPDLWRHRLFQKEMVAEIRPSFPVFLVAGNHDIDYGSKIARPERKVTAEVYESFYGPRNFDFVFNNCLFILCGVDLKRPDEYLGYLRDTLSLKGRGKAHIFIFVHYPPKGLADYIEGPLPKEEEFFSLIEAHQVRTCFFGDYHGYWRGERKGVNLIVSGGGGRFKDSQPEWGRFHHILRIGVDGNRVSEELMTLGMSTDFESGFEEGVFTRVLPLIGNSGWVLYILFVVFLSCAVYSVIILASKLRRTP
jgi:hypothetical protein